MTDTWTMVADTRTDLAGYLETLTPGQWDAPTLCAKWKVRDVVGHLVEGANKIPMSSMLGGMLKSGFNLNKMLAGTAIEEGKQSPEVLLKAMRETVSMRNTPPMTKPEDVLADAVIHTQDIRRALGSSDAIPEDRLRAALDRTKTVGSILGNKKRIAGLKLVATDMDWTYGDGPEVRGTGEALLMAMCGRQAALDDLAGDGVAMLRFALAEIAMPARESSTFPAVDELEAAVRSSAIPALLWDLRSMMITALSERAAELLGVEPSSETVDWLNIVDDPEPPRRGLESMRAGVFDSYEARRHVQRPDGEILDVVACVRVVDDARTLAIAVFVETDPALREELADVSATVGILDDARRIRQISSDVTPLLGYLPDVCLGMALESLVHPEDAGALVDLFSRVTADDANIAMNVRVRAADGSWRPLHLTLGPATGERTTFGFAAVPDEPVTVDAAGARAERVAELERHLSRIAREVEAAGIGRVGQFPDLPAVPGLSDLTSRQWQILTRILQGDRVPMVARSMFLSPSTVRNHLSVIYKKLGVHSQTELIEKFRPSESVPSDNV